MRVWSLRRIEPYPSSTDHVATDDSGTCIPPSAITVRSRSPSRSLRYGSARRTTISYSSLPVRYLAASTPLMALRIAPPTFAVFRS